MTGDRPLRVAVDARDTVRPEQGGWARYAARLVEGLEGRPDVEVIAYRRGPPRLPELWFEQVTLPALLARDRPDVVHAPNCFLPLRRPCAGVVTVHDLSFEHDRRDFGRLTGWKYRTFTRRSVASAERVIVPSRATARDLEETYGADPGRLRVVAEASPLRSAPSTVDLPSIRYVLAVSSLRRKKNLGRLVEAYERAREQGIEHVLMIVGEGGLPPRSAPGVELLGRVDDATLDALYRGADFCVYPSLHEGFGLVALEAMERGCPVALSGSTSLPEVGGEAAVYFDPTDVDDIAGAIVRLARDHELRARLAEEGRVHAASFTWERAVAETVGVYREAVAERAGR